MTHTSKHTPGPWVVRPDLSIETGQSGITIAGLVDMPADAHLIAAAPAMYADAKQLCELVRDFMNDNRLYDGQVIQAISNLETALSQAEGRDK